MKNKVIKWLLCGTVILNLSACSVLDQWMPSFGSETQTSEQPPLEMPSVLPIPQDYPGVFNVYQRIRVEADHQFTQNQPSEFEAMIAANRKGMKIALMAMGLKVWSIDYDGMVITEERGKEVPEALQALYLMRDIALVYWPTASLKAQLKDWTLVENAASRQIFAPGAATPAVTVSYQNGTKAQSAQGSVILENHLHHYRLTIQSNVVK